MPRIILLSKLPTQLKWLRFVAALKSLGYSELPSRGGSARHFQRSNEDPVTFHEPHGGDTIRQGTLTEYLRKLNLNRADFIQALESKVRTASIAASEQQFRRTSRPDGITVSHCMECLDMVAESELLNEVDRAESTHVCSAI